VALEDRNWPFSDPRDLPELDAILDDRPDLYYQHKLAS